MEVESSSQGGRIRLEGLLGYNPNGVNLAHKGISEYLRCIRCGGAESLFHVLRDCPWAQEVWVAAKISFPNGTVSSFRDCFDLVWSSKGPLETERIATICWQIWKCRNDRIFENINSPPFFVLVKLAIGSESIIMRCLFSLPIPQTSSEKAHWRAPPDGVIKVNFDGACGGEGDKMGIEFVARDHVGNFLMAG